MCACMSTFLIRAILKLRGQFFGIIVPPFPSPNSWTRVLNKACVVKWSSFDYPLPPKLSTGFIDASTQVIEKGIFFFMWQNVMESNSQF